MQHFPTSTEQLANATNFESLDSFDLLNQIRTSQWQVSPTSVTYSRDTEHTLSLYLSGGYNSYRLNQKSNKGSPGSLCLMPQGDESKWQVNESLELFHLYFSDTNFKQRVARLLDVDARLVNVQEMNYQKDRMLVQLINHISQAISSKELLNIEEGVNELFVRLALNYSSVKNNTRITGGLSKTQQLKINSFIKDNLCEKLSLEILAAELNMSAFHFARLFRKSFYLSPANYINALRIEKAKRLIKEGKPFIEIATDVGYCQQSHFSSNFKRLTGYTPMTYSKNI